MIEDLSSPQGVVFPGTLAHSVSLTDFGQHSSAFNASKRRESRSDSTLLVYQNADPQALEPEVTQLLVKARIVLPAVMNYLFFNTARIAVVYFGKQESADGTKRGIAEGAEDFKIRMIRYLTSEMWPPLLRTDAPDESLGADLVRRQTSALGSSTVIADAEPEDLAAARELAQERSWFKKSVESGMQILLYLKKGVDNTKYLKVILSNTNQRIHFDVVRTSDEKYRWDMRMLYTRLMDNLETQKAIDSYESYARYFEEACCFSLDHAKVLERPLQAMLTVNVWGDVALQQQRTFTFQAPGAPELLYFDALDASTHPHTHLNFHYPDRAAPHSTAPTPAAASPPSPPGDRDCDPSSTDASAPTLPGRYFRWMESLEKPESATLDYKSYFSHTAEEIKHRCVKFMCGFLNAYREGKLVIGVHELPRRDADGNLQTEKDGKNSIVLHNDLIDQYVVGVRITSEELADIQDEVSRQLLCCVPPIQPSLVQIDLIPVLFPPDFTFAKRILILYDVSTSFSRDPLKQKSNYAIRFLNPLGLTIVPLDLFDDGLEGLITDYTPEVNFDASRGNLKAEAYAIAAVSDAAMLEKNDWETALSHALGGPKNKCTHFFLDYPEDRYGPLQIAPLHVVEVSVSIKRTHFQPLLGYSGKFFAGWPSIPVWDAITRTVRQVERNYNIVRSMAVASSPSDHNTLSTMTTPATLFSAQRQGGAAGAGQDGRAVVSPYTARSTHSAGRTFARYLQRNGWAWFTDLKIVHHIFSFVHDPLMLADILHFRLVNTTFNNAFETREGTYLVEMVDRTPVGAPNLAADSTHISSMQSALLRSGVPPMPLLLCRVYEILGNLISPYPFVGVPLTSQSFRVAAFLVPIFYRQHYFDGKLRIAVVLDLRDGILKTMDLQDGNLILNAIIGVGFEPMNKRQVTRQLLRQEGVEDNTHLTTPDEVLADSLSLRRNVLSPLHSGTLFDGPYHREKSTILYRAPSPAAMARPDLKASFLARRSLLPNALRGNRESLQNSAMQTPHLAETFRQTSREVEPDIPLLHFDFLTSSSLTAEKAGGEEWFADLPVTPDSWTLQHLLSWYNALLTDPAHVRFFGYCDRSVAFHIESLSDVCEDDVEPYAANKSVAKEHLKFAPSQAQCVLHQKMKEWVSI